MVSPQPPEPDDAFDSDASPPGEAEAHRVVIVVGAHLRAEQADRPLAYKVVEEIEHWKRRHDDLLGVEIEPIVCCDLWFLNTESIRQLPTICIGGPGVNALSSYLAQHLEQESLNADVLIQVDPDFTDLQACIWGNDHELTAHGVQVFIDRYLDGYLRAVATQVEPKQE
jgi:hypothetical protein